MALKDQPGKLLSMNCAVKPRPMGIQWAWWAMRSTSWPDR
jgi:hypothetical protein